MDKNAIDKLGQALFEITNKDFIECTYADDDDPHFEMFSMQDIAEKLIAAGYGDVNEYKQQIEDLKAEISGANLLIKTLQNQIKSIQGFITSELNSSMSKKEAALGLQKSMNTNK